MPVPKWMSEFGINMVGLGVVLFQQEDFQLLDRSDVRKRLRENPSHIYIICRRPKVTFDPSSMEIKGNSVTGILCVQDKNTQRRFAFNLPHRVGDSYFEIDCPYPHGYLNFKRSSGGQIKWWKAGVIAGFVADPLLEKELALEVLYVGQAYGVNGSRTAIDRLKRHETLQAIYSQAIARSPDKDIWITLWSFTSRLLTAIDGRWNQYGTTTEEDDKHIEDVLSNPITEQQEINFTEAALIRYFQPQYNQNFKNTFPSPAHATYSQCYDLDINSIMLELNTEHFSAPFWSAAAPGELHHIIQYQFHSHDERRSMFEVVVPDEYAR
jgi:hypothetical protein